MSANKVKFNLKNVHYAGITETVENGVTSYTYGTPVAIPGAVSLSLEANGEPTPFYADGYAYYMVNSNMGYTGDLEIALIPESFRTGIMGETLDSNNVLTERSSDSIKRFALLFQFDGDVHEICHVLYYCSASRPTISSQTNEETAEVRTETLSIQASPRADGLIKAKTGEEASAATIKSWFTTVYVPAAPTP